MLHQVQLATPVLLSDATNLRDSTGAIKTSHSVNVWGHYVNSGLDQISVAEGCIAVPAVLELLETINLQGAALTSNARHCQK